MWTRRQPHLFRNRLVVWLWIISLVLGGRGAVTLAQPDAEPVTLHVLGDPAFDADPQAAATGSQFQLAGAFFLSLIDFDPVTRQIAPRLATAWAFDDTTNTWTFSLRADVSWVRRETETGAIVPLRPVVAADFVTGIRRACDPRLGNYYRTIVASAVAGCQVPAEADPLTFDPALLEQVEVRAVDDTTLTITLTGPRVYFLSMTWLPALRAVPGEVIEQYGADWATLEHILTNGPFVASLSIPEVRLEFERNPWLPADLAGPGNVERVVLVNAPDTTTAMLLYLDGEIDRIPASREDLHPYLPDDPGLLDQLVLVAGEVVWSLAFDQGQPPFDDVHVRRAFSAVIDREAYVTDILPGAGVPMMHWVPPGAFGASPIDQVGIDQGPSRGFDPDFARAELALAGYPDCQGFPEVTYATFPEGQIFGEFLQGMIQTHLGCPMEVLRIEAYEFVTLLELISKDSPGEQHPELWPAGWGPDYPDANNWLYDAGLHCESTNDMRAACTAWDDLVLAAQTEIDLDRRAAMYREAEELMFGYAGEFRIAPIFLSAGSVLVKPWVSAPSDYALLNRWDWITVDPVLQQAARAAS